MNEKDLRLAEFCRSRAVDGVVLRRRANIAWITDGADTHIDLSSRLGIATVVWTPSRKTVLTDTIEAARLREEEFGSEWEVRASNWWEDPLVPDPGARYETDWPEDAVAPLRWSLTPDELARVRDLGRDAAETMEAAMRSVRRGQPEHQLAGEIIGALRARNVHTPVMLVASDDRLRAFRHPIPTDKTIDHVVMAAICAQRHGLTVSITRLVHFGPVEPDLRRRHDAVCRVDQALHEATRPGVRWCDALAAGQRAYADTGFADEWKLHHQGGPMGYELREFKATPTETRTAVENQLVGWNPSITGTKSEDTILITPASHEIVTTMRDWPLNPAVPTRPDILVR